MAGLLSAGLLLSGPALAQCDISPQTVRAFELLRARGVLPDPMGGQPDWCDAAVRQASAAQLTRLLAELPAQQSRFSADELLTLRLGLADDLSGAGSADTVELRQEIAELRAQIAALQPRAASRAHFQRYLGVSFSGVLQQAQGFLTQLLLGDDSLSGNFGARLSADIALSGDTPGNTLAGLATYKVGDTRLGGLIGVGGGYNFDMSRQAFFGTLLIGADFRVTERFSVFGEARQQFYFDETSDTVSSLAAGLKIRF